MPITLRPAAPVSDEEPMRLSEQNRPCKVERNKDGELTLMTSVGGIGGTREKYVDGVLFIWTENDGTGIDFGPNTGFNLPGGSCLAPDAAWMALDRRNALTQEQKAGYPPLCPDFVIEIRSRTDPRRIVEAEMQTWLDNGARLAWLIDPIDGSVTIYRPGQTPETLDRPENIKGEGPVAGFELRCTRLWSPR